MRSRGTNTAATWPDGSRCSSGWTARRPPPSTGSAPPACRRPGWRTTRSRPARVTRSCPPASSACPATPVSARPGVDATQTQNPLFERARRRTERTAETNEIWHDPRIDGELPDIYIAMGQTAENVATAYGVTRAEQDAFGVRSQNLAEKAIANGVFEREIVPVVLPDGTVVSFDDGPRPGTTLEAVSALKPVFRPERDRDGRQLLPTERRRCRRRHHERRPGRRTGPAAAGSDRGHRGQCAQPGDHGSRPGRGLSTGAAAGRDEHLGHGPGRDQRGVRGSGHRVRPAARRSIPSGSTSTAGPSRSVIRSGRPGPGS